MKDSMKSENDRTRRFREVSSWHRVLATCVVLAFCLDVVRTVYCSSESDPSAFAGGTLTGESSRGAESSREPAENTSSSCSSCAARPGTPTPAQYLLTRLNIYKHTPHQRYMLKKQALEAAASRFGHLGALKETYAVIAALEENFEGLRGKRLQEATQNIDSRISSIILPLEALSILERHTMEPTATGGPRWRRPSQRRRAPSSPGVTRRARATHATVPTMARQPVGLGSGASVSRPGVPTEKEMWTE